MGGQGTEGPDADERDLEPATPSRRHLLRTAGVAGVAAMGAVGASTLLADPAGAVDLTAVLFPVGPIRVYDTRDGEGRISANQQRTLVGGALDGDLAHLYNVTVTETAGSGGFLAVFPGDIAWPGTSSINWFGPGQTLANNAYTFLAEGDGAIRLRVGGPAGSSTHVVLDLVGVLQIFDFDATLAGARLAASAHQQDRALHSIETE